MRKQEELEKEVYELVSTNGYATIEDVYEVYLGKYGRKSWSGELLARLSKCVLSKGRTKKLELAITGNPVAIYQGRHAVGQAVFFVDVNEDESAAIEKCTNMLNDMIRAAEGRKREKHLQKVRNASERKKQNGRKHIVPEKLIIGAIRRVTSQSLTVDSPGFVSSKMVRLSMLHHFLFVTFSGPFTISDVLDNMSTELFMKIVGVMSTPSVVEKEPKLRFLLLKCLPENMRLEIDVDRAKPKIKKFLDKMCSLNPHCSFPLRLLDKTGNGIYRVIRCSRLVELFQGFRLYMRNAEDVEWLWRCLEMVDLLENFDGFSKIIWKKR